MSTEYEDRRRRKADRFRNYAASAQQNSDRARRERDRISDGIPFGQPILVGHHSEAHARRDADRIWALTGRAITEAQRAQEWERRAATIESDTSINRNDPEAVAKLQAAVETLEAQLQRRKDVNQLLKRRVLSPPATREDALEILDLAHQVGWLTEAEHTELHNATRYSPLFERLGYPGYAMTNLSANLRRYKQRRADVEGWQQRAGALEVADTRHSKGVSTYHLSNGWMILRDRARRNQAQYRVLDGDGQQVGEYQWTWRFALDHAEKESKRD